MAIMAYLDEKTACGPNFSITTFFLPELFDTKAGRILFAAGGRQLWQILTKFRV